MSNTSITKEVFNFLNTLKENNDREWFTENKKRFKAAETVAKSVFQAIYENVQEHDDIERLKTFRIYRDVRFSHDKTPYKVNFSAGLSRSGVQLRGGYYIHIQPKGSFIAAGFWAPNKEDLLRIRKEWELDASELRDILANKNFQKTWGELTGDGVKTAPKGFSKEDPNIDLIRKKQFILVKNFNDKAVMDPKFATEVSEAFKQVRPFFDLMSNILTTDLNGASVIGQ